MMSGGKLLYWVPRVLSIGFVLFLSVFALDVFQGPFEPAMLVGFAVHLAPSLALLALVLVAWRYPLVGAAAFFGFALWYVWSVGFDRPWSWYMAIAAPAVVVGALFGISWIQERRQGVEPVH